MNMQTLKFNSADKYSSNRAMIKIVIACLIAIFFWQNVQAGGFNKKIPIKPIKLFNLHNSSSNSQCPKLEIRGLRIKKVDFYNHNYFIYLSGYVKNIGGANFPSARKNHNVVFSAKAIPTTTANFGAIAKGRSVPFEGLVRGNIGGEFTPDIRVKIQLNKMSGEKLKSTCMVKGTGYKIYSQREIIISRNEVNRAIANYHRSHPKAKKADLVLLGAAYTNKGQAVYEIKNQGGANARANVLVMTCKKVGFKGRKGFGCPKAIENLPYNTASQGYLINVPAIRAGQLYRLFVPLHKKVKWKKGRYQFTYLVDAKNAVPESNERNNSKAMTINK